MVRLPLLAAGLLSAAVSVTGHPVEKVIGLLKDLAGKAQAEGKTEEVSYTTFEHWCANSVKDLNKAMAEEKATLENLESEIASHTKNIKVLGDSIKVLDDNLLQLDQEGSAAEKDRAAGNDLYKQEKKALEDTIEAIKAATTILQSTKSGTDTGLLAARSSIHSLLALISYRASEEQMQTLQSFAGDRPDVLAKGDQQKHVKGYRFKSDSVIELLKELSLKFQDELTATNTEETNAVNAYTLAKQARDALVQAKKDLKKSQEDEKASSEEDLNTAQASHVSTTADLASDTQSLSDTKSACSTKQAEWQERSTTRAREIEAIETAIAILAKVTGVRTEAPGNPVPPPSPVALLQISQPKAQQALRILRQEANIVHSKTLDRIVDDVTERVKHGDGAFDQVINSIQKMIHLLMNEQTEEDNHKNWCDQELSKTNTSITDKTEKSKELSLKIADAQAQAAKLAEDVRAADEMVGKIQAHMDEATSIRNIGREENRLAVKDSEDAQTALASATAVLKDFYKSSGGMKKESWEFLQGAAPVDLPDTPSTWAAGYTGVADPAAQPAGIVAVLEKISADFSMMESQTRAQEESDQAAYDQEISSSKIEMARRQEESKQKGAEEKRVLEKQRSMEAERKGVNGELEATQQYLKDLQPACVEGSSSYVERKEARAQEVVALKQAQDLLQNAFEDKGEAEPVLQPGSFLAVRRHTAVGTLRTD